MDNCLQLHHLFRSKKFVHTGDPQTFSILPFSCHFTWDFPIPWFRKYQTVLRILLVYVPRMLVMSISCFLANTKYFFYPWGPHIMMAMNLRRMEPSDPCQYLPSQTTGSCSWRHGTLVLQAKLYKITSFLVNCFLLFSSCSLLAHCNNTLAVLNAKWSPWSTRGYIYKITSFLVVSFSFPHSEIRKSRENKPSFPVYTISLWYQNKPCATRVTALWFKQPICLYSSCKHQ